MMSNQEIKQAIPKTGNFCILQVTDDGLSRVDGKNTYTTLEQAETAARDKLREDGYANIIISVLEIASSYWVDRDPNVIGEKANKYHPKTSTKG